MRETALVQHYRRALLSTQRTDTLKHICSLLTGFTFVVTQGTSHLQQSLSQQIHGPSSPLLNLVQSVFGNLHGRLAGLDRPLAYYSLGPLGAEN